MHLHILHHKINTQIFFAHKLNSADIDDAMQI